MKFKKYIKVHESPREFYKMLANNGNSENPKKSL